MFNERTHFDSAERLLHADVYQYNALSDGVKKLYTNQDELTEYGTRGILNPKQVSYFNLFINGLLQPRVNYEIQEGLLLLKTDDVPLKDSTIIIVFVTFKDEEWAELNSALVEGIIPSGQIRGGPVTDRDIKIRDTTYSYLKMENLRVSGPEFISAENAAHWEFSLTISNTGNIPIRDIVVTDTILLDLIAKIENLSLSQGHILINHERITWFIDQLNPRDSATASFKAEGLFQAAGIRFLSRGFAAGNSSSGAITTDIVGGEAIKVSRGLEITQTIIGGPVQVNAGKSNIWRVELKLANLSADNATDILVTDALLTENTHVKVVSLSGGTAQAINNDILWRIDELKALETAVLSIDITGSFAREGLSSLGTASGMGNIPAGKLFTNRSQDFQIVVFPAANPAEEGLLLQVTVLNNPLTCSLGIAKKWRFSLEITNLTSEVITHIIAIAYLLFDEADDIRTASVSSGEISISPGTIVWNLEELLPGETLRAVFEAEGIFRTAGLRSLCRGIATGWSSNSCLISGIAAGASFRVLEYVKACVIVDKVFSQYQLRHCFEDIVVDLPGGFQSILFKPGFITENSLKINAIKDRVHFRRVQFLLKIPFEIVTADNTRSKGSLPDIVSDIIMFMPETRDEFSYSIAVETRSKLLNTPKSCDGRLHFSVGVFMLIRAVGKVSLQIPSYGFFPELPEWEEAFVHADFYPPLPEHWPQNTRVKATVKARVTSRIPCPQIFGSLTIEKYIVSGPLEVPPHGVLTWTTEIRVSNNGYGPVSKVLLTDTLLLDTLLNLNILSLSQGTVSPKGSQIIWDIGTLNANNTIVLSAEITGSFKAEDHLLKGEKSQYNAISDGVRTSFTNADELTIYGDNGIPNPAEVSFFNLYVNGVLQPQINYTVAEGLLTLTTQSPPSTGVPIILESLIIKNKNDILLQAAIYQFNAFAGGERVYTNEDEIMMYGDEGILDPRQTSYQMLFINGVIQPEKNYTLQKGLLILEVACLPKPGVPISIQFVSLSSAGLGLVTL
ncbi:DUF4183 domain-containing protein [Desulfosporosinus youngiae]|uniref:DUF4183 domain-containing protein n=1 Tax=Desulfosporosinus youngiae DSM 17734 TaxID=768710 RepID=H5XW50_9FIRM|nr:DUF4183 domain-containing protein [Desulfosporosinus youngiae]EHQ90643.1 hypothetical protein DesyoDRAFT_3645 [Desulfosporosinus youngiae DSM 17734]